nr:hypothetical protein [Tanacetum cinerariifolium]
MSAKRTAWNEFNCSMASAVICLATGRKFNFSKYIFDSMVRNVDIPSKFLMIGKGFSGIETPLFATMLVQPQAALEEEDEDDEVAALEKDKVAKALEIFKLKRRVKKLKKQRRSNYLGLKRLRKVGTSQRVESLTEIVMGAQEDGRIKRKDDANATNKGVNAAEPTMFNDEEVTITMAQTLIMMKAEKARILDEQMAKRLHDEEIEQAAARQKQEQDDFKRAQELQQQYDKKQEKIDWNVVAEQMQEKYLDNIKKYQSLKRKPISVAQAKKNMIVYLKNMAGYKMEHFK